MSKNKNVNKDENRDKTLNETIGEWNKRQKNYDKMTYEEYCEKVRKLIIEESIKLGYSPCQTDEKEYINLQIDRGNPTTKSFKKCQKELTKLFTELSEGELCTTADILLYSLYPSKWDDYFYFKIEILRK